jgi:hypothetical protein
MSENAQQRRPDRDVDTGDPDVLLDIPKVSVDSIRLVVDGLDADISLRARLANLLQLDAGVRVHLHGVELDIDGVHAEAQLRVRLEQLVTLLGRALDTIDNNPQVIESISRAGGGALDDVNRSSEQVAAGAAEVTARAQHGNVPVRPVRPSTNPPVATSAPGPSGTPTGGRGDRGQPESVLSGGGPGSGGPGGGGPAGGDQGGGGQVGGGVAGGAQAAAQSAAQPAEQAGESIRQAGRSVWEAIQGGIAQHRQQGRGDQ